MPEGTMRIFSLNPETFVTGGLISDVDCVMRGFEFTSWDYNGKGKETVALKATIIIDGQEGEHEQYWSVGSPELNSVVEEGKSVASAGASGFNKNSNCGLFLTSLLQCGMDGRRMEDGDVTKLNGIKLHLLRKPTKGLREGMPDRDSGAERKYEEAVLCATVVYQWPWDKKPAGKPRTTATATAKAVPAAAQAAAPAAAAPAAVAAVAAAADVQNGDYATLAMETLIAMIKERGGVEFAKVKPYIFQALNTLPTATRKEVGDLVSSSEWLAENGFSVDGGVITV